MTYLVKELFRVLGRNFDPQSVVTTQEYYYFDRDFLMVRINVVDYMRGGVQQSLLVPVGAEFLQKFFARNLRSTP